MVLVIQTVLSVSNSYVSSLRKESMQQCTLNIFSNTVIKISTSTLVFVFLSVIRLRGTILYFLPFFCRLCWNLPSI